MAKESAKHSELTIISLPGSFHNQENIAHAHYQLEIKNKGRVAKRWLDFTRKSKKIVKVLRAAGHRFTSIIASDLYSLPAAEYAYKKIKESPECHFIYDSREIYSALGSLADRPAAQAITSRIEKRYLRNVETVLASGKSDIEYISKRFPENLKYQLLLNLPHYQAVNNNSLLRDKFSLDKNKKVAIYQGAISHGRGLQLCIDTFKLLPSWEFIALGQGPQLEHFRNKSAEFKNLHFPGPVPYDELLNYTAGADIGLSLIEPISESYKFALPNKLFEYFMAGLPVIATDLPAMKEVIEEHGGGKLVNHNISPEKLSQILIDIDDDELNTLATEAKKASKVYSYESQSHIISNLIR